MRKIYLIIFMMIIIFIIITNLNICMGKDNLILKTDKENIEVGETFKIYININDIKVASYMLNIYFDSDKLEYISGPDNTNIIENRIINIWYDETGGNGLKTNQEIAVFEFKAKEKSGIASFNLIGEFFDENANIIDVNNCHIQVNINEKIQNTNNSKNNSGSTKLSILRLNKEGIIPEFSSDVYEYYFIADLSTNLLEITAIPEDENAKIEISGNQDLKEGYNKIAINVISEDQSKKETYIINVTKTENKELANANLEILAIENVMMEPLFDTNILNYKVNVANNMEKLNIFAVPENETGKVEIIGGENLQIGYNEIIVNSIAPNGFTNKKYKILVHRRSSEEDIKYEEEKKIESEKLNAILEEKEIDNKEEKNIENIQNDKNNNYTAIIFLILSIVIRIIILKKYKI